jgi:hypothetical protein
MELSTEVPEMEETSFPEDFMEQSCYLALKF